MTAFLGCDPGLDGAFCLITGTLQPSLFPMPTLTLPPKKPGGKKQRIVDFARTRSMLRGLKGEHANLFVLIERAQLRPAVIASGHTCPICHEPHLKVNQGITSQVKASVAYERIIEQLECLEIPYEDIHPRTWKADVFHGASDKTDARLKAMHLFPVIAHHFKRVNSDGLAEALLLADYGRRRRAMTDEDPF